MSHRNLRFLIFLACLSLISSFAKMPTAYSCPSGSCTDCYVWNGHRCIYNCPDCSTCSDGGCVSTCICPNCSYCENGSCHCYEVTFDDLYPNHHVYTCVGGQSFAVAKPSCFDGWFYPYCCFYLIWSAPGGDPARWSDGDVGGLSCPWACHFNTTYNTPGVYTVTATLPCGSSDSLTVYVMSCGDDDSDCPGDCCYSCCGESGCDCPSGGHPGFPAGFPGFPGGFPDFGSGGPRATGLPTAGDPVYIKNGEYKLNVTDLSIRGRALTVEITRTYGSHREKEYRFGYGWDMNYNLKVWRVSEEGNLIWSNPIAILFLDGKGNKYRYNRDSIDPNKYVRSQSPRQYFLHDDVNDTFTLITAGGVKYAFNTVDYLKTITDENGNKITFGYNANGLSTITDDLGRVINVTCNANGLIEMIADFNSRTWQYNYDPNTNDLLSVTGPTGLVTNYDYTNHNLTYIYDPCEQRVLKNIYDATNPERIWKQDVGDGTYIFNYNVITTITDRDGFETEMAYNSDGQLASHKVYTADRSESFTTTYKYDPTTLQRTRVIYPAGNCADFTYDNSGRLTGIYRKTGPNEPNNPNGPNVIATTYTYDPNFDYKIKRVTDPMGNTTTYDYYLSGNLKGNLKSITYPVVQTPTGNKTPVERFTYNSFGQIETVTDPNGMVTKCVYYGASEPNGWGQLHKVIVDANEADPNLLEITTEYKYDALCRVIEVNDPNGNVTKDAYNKLDQLTKITDPLGHITKFSYDYNGNRSRIEREISGPNQITSFAYNVRNKLTQLTDPCGYVTRYGYNKNEDPNLIIDAESNSTITKYNERHLPTEVTDANGGVTKYSYDKNGNISEANDPNNNTTTYTYDDFDRLVKITYSNDSNEVFGYDKNSNIITKTNRKGETINYEYDAMNRMVVKDRPGATDIIRYLYDIAGRLVDVNDVPRGVTNGGGWTRYKYDRVGRVIEVNDIEGRIVKYQYDKLGRRTKLTYPDNSNVTYEYDCLSRLKKVKYNGSTIAEYEYDELSRRTLLTLGNDANAVYQYDIGNRLKKLTNNFAGSSSIVFDYSKYDKVGNRLRCKIDDAGAHAYSYDKLYQLTFVDYNDGNSTGYYYDKLGNRRKVINGGTTNYISNKLNQYTSVGGATYTYDSNGNLTNDGTKLYYYDCENRLIKSIPSTCYYRYDYLGRRVRKGLATWTKYCYDGDQVIAEYNYASQLQRKYVYGPGIDEPICMIRYTNPTGTYYYHFDGLGSVVALSNGSGNIAEKYKYDVFGKPEIRNANDQILTTSAYGNSYMFTARNYDSETQLYYYRARYYKPSIGRFLQTDLIGYYYSMNLNEYCWNNPLNWLDPYGLRGRRETAEGARCYLDSITGGVAGGGEAALGGGTSIHGYATALRSLERDPDFIMDPRYDRLRDIASIPGRTGMDPILPPRTPLRAPPTPPTARSPVRYIIIIPAPYIPIFAPIDVPYLPFAPYPSSSSPYIIGPIF